jgi:hypothetical protein
MPGRGAGHMVLVFKKSGEMTHPGTGRPNSFWIVVLKGGMQFMPIPRATLCAQSTMAKNYPGISNDLIFFHKTPLKG